MSKPYPTRRTQTLSLPKIFKILGLLFAALILSAIIFVSVFNSIEKHRADRRFQLAVVKCGAEPILIRYSYSLENVQEFSVIAPGASGYKSGISYSFFNWDSFYSYACSVSQAETQLKSVGLDEFILQTIGGPKEYKF
jgi:hypothetical protein